MGYVIAVDVGTSRTAAATARIVGNGSPTATSFALGRHADSVPTSVFVSSDELLWGDAAERRGITQPERLIREFKRRIGDDVPIVAGDQHFTAEQLYAGMVGWVVQTIREREGRTPDRIAVTVPVTWGEYRTDLVTRALEREGLSDVVVITEPEAAARHYEIANPLAAGHALAVYDLGGGTFDAVILRKDDDGELRPAGEPAGIRDLGGADFDDAVLRHTIATAGFSLAALASDPRTRMSVAALRRECVDAKEALSFDSDVSVPMLLGERETTVRLTRAEFENMIEDAVDRTADVLADALESADVDADLIDAILLTGGSSRIPRIAQRLSERFERPIAIDADPKAIIALGAAGAIAGRAAHGSAVLPLAAPVAASAAAVGAAGAVAATGTSSEIVAGLAADDAEPVGDDISDLDPTVARPERRSWFRRAPAAVATGIGVVALATTMVAVSASSLGGSGFPNSLATSAASAQPAGLSLPWAWDAAEQEITAPAAADAPMIAPLTAPVAPSTTAPRRPATTQPANKKPTSAPSTSRPESSTGATGSTGATPAGAKPKAAPTPEPSVPSAQPTPSAPATTPTPTTPAPAPDPEPTTTAPTPTPEPTTPAPEPSTPAPEPTTPAPEPTTPAPEPTTPAPEPTPEPSSPAAEPPADPSPSPSEPAPQPEPSSTEAAPN